MKNSKIPQAVQEKAFTVVAAHIAAAGLRIEENFRVSDQGMALTHRAAAVLKATGCPIAIPGNDSLEGMGLDRTDGFFHPLSDHIETADRLGGGAMNTWACASLMVSVSLGWIESDCPDKPRKIMTEAIAGIAPNVSVAGLMEQARYSDAALLKIISLTKEGLDNQIQEAIELTKIIDSRLTILRFVSYNNHIPDRGFLNDNNYRNRP